MAVKAKKKNDKPLKKLVIVESPSKASTIKKYLGDEYDVKASIGHIIDLPKSRLGINLDTLDPDYIVMRDKSKVIKELRESAKYASEIILASDPDREGEAIAWHIRNDLTTRVLSKLKDREVPVRRIRFDEITQPAVRQAIQQAVDIDLKLVNAQQGRRVIDRLFGYQLSPLLWKKVKSRLSAGRVQSIALRLICEREDLIDRFVPIEYWDLTANCTKGKTHFEAELTKIDGRRVVTPNEDMRASLKGDVAVVNDKSAVICTEAGAKKIEAELKSNDSVIGDIRSKESKRYASPPFITSTLQQAANSLFGFTSIKTMMIAQKLYEGIDLDSTRMGLITYMRTDSVRISAVALESVRQFITGKYGESYLPASPNTYKNTKSAQDAHEAIRPTDVNLLPEKLKDKLAPDEFKLYSLIWGRFVASQMNPAVSEQTTVEIENGNKTLAATFSRTLFDGFLKAYNFSKQEKDKLPPTGVAKGDKVSLQKITLKQKFTEPPARFTDASLVKTMEELGIGRPSTYAPTIYTLTKRYYVKKSGRSLFPTELGRIVNKLLVENFPNLISVKFTADMEEELDEVEDGSKEWKKVVKDFYDPFSKVLNHAYEHIDSIKGIFDEPTEYKCDKCGAPMVKKLGKNGYFIACSRWPDCKNAQPLPLGKCPKCEDGRVIQRKGKKGKGRIFFGCSNYPECDFSTYQTPSEESCPKDGSVLFLKKEQNKKLLVCLKEDCGYEKTVD